MARRRKHRGRGKKSIPILPVFAAIQPALQADILHPDRDTPKKLMYQYTGYDADDRRVSWTKTGQTLGLVLAGYVGHRVANKLGVNRHIRKATLGWLEL